MATSTVKGFAQLEKLLDLYLRQKAPALPEKFKKVIVDFAPWVNVALIVVALPALLAVFGITSTITYWGYWGVRLGLMYYIALAFLVLTLAVRALAIPGLFSKSIGGWRLLYYSVFFDLVHSLLSGSVVGPIISAIVGFYFLFQIKGYYKR